MRQPLALLIAGPTASGKSALALGLAQRFGGTIINADSMQLYAELRVLTARPTPAEEALVPHRLYGVHPAARPASAAWWRNAALAELAANRAAGRLSILCGGTGLYFHVLRQGLSAVPPVPGTARRTARELLALLGAPGLHARLAAIDPATAATLRPSDGQRVARAFEVVQGTGRGLADWRRATRPDAAPGWRFAAILLDPPRDALRAAIAARFATMLRAGAPEEVRELARLGLDPALPAMRAHGVPELLAQLRGELSPADAATRTIAAVGRYVKRQATWFRHHALAAADDTHTFHARFAGVSQLSECEWGIILAFVNARVDAVQHAD